jgi:hypothetical protein
MCLMMIIQLDRNVYQTQKYTNINIVIFDLFIMNYVVLTVVIP